MNRTARASLAAAALTVAAIAGITYSALGVGASFGAATVSLPTGVALAVAALAKVVLAVAPLRLATSRVPAVRGLLALLALTSTCYGLARVGDGSPTGLVLALWGVALGLGLRAAGGSVVRRRPAPRRLGVPAAPLRREPPLLARAGGPGGPAGGWRRGEGLPDHRGDPFARGDAVASL
jgi:hypothetical protein